MVKTIISDFSRVILLPDENISGSLNTFYDANKDNADFDFSKYFQLNSGLLDYFHTLKVNRFIFTSGRLHLLEHIKLALASTFERAIQEDEVGYPKDNPNAYTELAKLLKLKPAEIIFLDDKSENVAAAIKAGMKGIIFKDNQQARAEIDSYLSR